MPTRWADSPRPTTASYLVGDRFHSHHLDSSTVWGGVPANSPNGIALELDRGDTDRYSGLFRALCVRGRSSATGLTTTSHGCLNVSRAMRLVLQTLTR